MPPRERGRYQGYLASVVVTASTAGPVIGAVLAANLGWRSVFTAFLPLILLAMLLARRVPSMGYQPRTWRLDTIGLLLFALFVTTFLIMLDRIRSTPLEWSVATVALLALAILALVALLLYEMRLPEPLIPLKLLRLPAIWISNCVAFCHGASLVALVTLLPFYLRVVHGLSVEESGFMLVPLTASIGLGSFIAGRLVSRTGHTALLPSICLTVVTGAMLVICLLPGQISRTGLIALLVVFGLGMGPTMAVVQLTVQVATGKGALGVAAGFVQFSRSIGAALGTAIASTALFATINIGAEGGVDVVAAIMTNNTNAANSEVVEIATKGFRAAFLAIASFTALGAILAWRIPLRRV